MEDAVFILFGGTAQAIALLTHRRVKSNDDDVRGDICVSPDIAFAPHEHNAYSELPDMKAVIICSD